MKSASAPPRGGAREPGSYYWCSIGIVSIDYQSKRRDVRTAAHRWRCDGWARKRSFFAGRVSPNKASETQPTRLNVRSTCSNHTYIYFSVPPPPTQYRRAILYDTYIIYTLAGGKPAMSLFIHPPSKSLSSTRLRRPLIHPPSKASYPPAFIII